MTKHIFPFLCLFIGMTTFTDAQNFSSTEITINRYVDGTLLVPESVENPPLSLLLRAQALPIEMATSPS